MNKKNTIQILALFIALLFHISGLAGILFTQYKDWFIQNTYINLLLMAALILVTHPSKNKNFFIFFMAAFVIGFAIEVLGVNTGLLFGRYNYSDILGIKVFNVPLIIGINWFIIIYCAGMVTQAYENFMIKKINEQGIAINKRMKLVSFIIDASFLSLLFDWVMEPVASKLGYWQWQNDEIPFFNYVSWMIAGALLLWLFRKLNQNSHNKFAVHLFIIQLLFFLVLRTFL